MLIHKAQEFLENSSYLAPWCPKPFKPWNSSLYAAHMRPAFHITPVPPDRDFFAFLIPPPLIFTRRRDQPPTAQNREDRLHHLFFIWCCIRGTLLNRLESTTDYSARQQWRLTRQQWNDVLSGHYFRKLWPVLPGHKLNGDFDITLFWLHGWGPLFDNMPDSSPVPMFGDRPLVPADFACDSLKAIVAYDVAINSIHFEFTEADQILTKDHSPDENRTLLRTLVFQMGLKLGSTRVPDSTHPETSRISWKNRFLRLIKDWPQCAGLPPINPEETNECQVDESLHRYIPAYYQGIMDALRIPPTMLFESPQVSDILQAKLASF